MNCQYSSHSGPAQAEWLVRMNTPFNCGCMPTDEGVRRFCTPCLERRTSGGTKRCIQCGDRSEKWDNVDSISRLP